ncbi:MAG: hypothetical protein Q8P32_00845 [Candidatus Komeilibacteria bacterium]|nr:hypothetical protein [Candidatus Komeilibacteria bacterium]
MNKKYIASKILVSLLPAIIFTQNYAWMTLNKGAGIAFILFWAFTAALVFNIGNKNRLLKELFRISEIGMFLLPISAIVFTVAFGSSVVTQTNGGAAQAGAALGAAIGGTMAIGLGFVIGLFGGLIFHLIANNFNKKLEKSGSDQDEEKEDKTFYEKHRSLTMIIALIIMAIIGGSIAMSSSVKEIVNSNNPVKSDNDSEQQVNVIDNKEPSPVEIVSTSVTKNIIDTPVANLKVKNISEKIIDGLKVNIKTFNNFDEPVNGFLSDNNFDGIAQKTINPGATIDISWELFGYDTATKITAEIYETHFADGNSWQK